MAKPSQTLQVLQHLHDHALQQKLAIEDLMALTRRILRKISKMAGELERVQTEVTEISGTIDSAVALLAQLAQLIRDNVTDPAALNDIADQLDSKGSELAAAVVANAPEPEPEPEPEA